MSEEKDVKAMAFIALLGIPMVIIVQCIVDGYALSVLWGWFVVKQFSLPALSIPLAIGVSLVANNLTHQFPPDVEEKERGPFEKLGLAFMRSTFKPLFLLLIGWIVKAFL